MNEPSASRVGPVGDAPTARKHERPTPDMMYLASRLNGEAAFEDETEKARRSITPAALQKWIVIYGVEAVTGALRMAWGFPPMDGIENPYAYVEGVLRG